MFSSDKVLALDYGASKIVLAEFNVKDPAMPTLVGCVVRNIEDASKTEISFSNLVEEGVLNEMMVEGGFKPSPLLVLLSGQTVFQRFVKFPRLPDDKLNKMIFDEAEQNLPFPIDNVEWDYQIMDSDDSAEIDALIVAVKKDISHEIGECATKMGLDLEKIDAAPLALYNAVKYNYPDLDGCTMALDMGSRSTNLVFIEGNHIFVRNIMIGGNTITAEIAKSFGISFEEAEDLKRKKGFVALGGTFALPDDEEADKMSKIIRNVATRLHMEINRSINFYRSQQNGAAPTKVLLTGGGALLRGVEIFFKEKMNIEVDYLNPFTNMAVAPSVTADNETLFMLAGCCGIVLSCCVKCPVEINLVPQFVTTAKQFKGRIPFFGIAAVGLILTLICWYSFALKQESIYEGRSKKTKEKVQKLNRNKQALEVEKSAFEECNVKLEYLTDFINSRDAYIVLLDAVRKSLLPGTWVTSFAIKDGELLLSVTGYKDKLEKADEGSNKSAAEILVDRLVDTKMFDKKNTGVVKDDSTEEILRYIELKAKLLKDPSVIGKGTEIEAGEEE